MYEKHTHECRRCGGSIRCSGDGDGCWEGDNIGCDCEAGVAGDSLAGITATVAALAADGRSF